MIVSGRSGLKRQSWSASLMSQRESQVRLIQPDLIAL
jgi:hypothetical protein